MNAKYWFAILMITGAAATAHAEPLLFSGRLTSATCPPSCYNCPDDYCRKPQPCIRPMCGCFLGDDYCRKPVPCAACPVKGCGDDYCSKPFPRCLPPSLSPWNSCGECGK